MVYGTGVGPDASAKRTLAGTWPPGRFRADRVTSVLADRLAFPGAGEERPMGRFRTYVDRARRGRRQGRRRLGPQTAPGGGSRGAIPPILRCSSARMGTFRLPLDKLAGMETPNLLRWGRPTATRHLTVRLNLPPIPLTRCPCSPLGAPTAARARRSTKSHEAVQARRAP